MNKKTRNLLLIAGVVIGGVIIYNRWKKKNGAVVAAKAEEEEKKAEFLGGFMPNPSRQMRGSNTGGAMMATTEKKCPKGYRYIPATGNCHPIN